WVIYQVQKANIVAPGQLSNKLLDNCPGAMPLKTHAAAKIPEEGPAITSNTHNPANKDPFHRPQHSRHTLQLPPPALMRSTCIPMCNRCMLREQRLLPPDCFHSKSCNSYPHNQCIHPREHHRSTANQRHMLKVPGRIESSKATRE